MSTVIFGARGFVGSSLGPDLDLAFKPNKSVCDLTNLDSVLTYLDGTKPEAIVNMAARVGGFQYNKINNVELLRDNSLIALNLATAIKKLRLSCYYIYVSSACVYRDGNSQEDSVFLDNPNNNNFGYGHSKRLGHKVIDALNIDCPDLIKSCILIPTNMYGPHDHFDPFVSHVIPNLIRQMVSKEDTIKVLGNPNNGRDFMYSGDLCNAISECLRKKIEGTYNVSTFLTVTIKSIVETLVEITGYEGVIEMEEPDESKEAEVRTLNNTKIVEALNLSDDAFTDLKEGLKQTIEWYKSGN